MRGAPCRDEVIVLGSIKLGETSQIVSCLARGHGRVKLVAKGTRKPRGRWAGLLEPGNELEAVYYARPGRDLWTLSEAGLMRAALTGGDSLDKLSYLLAVLELVNRLLPEREPVDSVVEIVRRYLDRWHRESTGAMPALFFAFEIALLRELGLSTDLYRCGDCGRSLTGAESVFFRPSEGDLSCADCGGGQGLWLGAEDLQLWRSLDGLLEEETAPDVDDEGKRRIGKILHLHMLVHLPRYRVPASLFWLSALRDSEGEKS